MSPNRPFCPVLNSSFSLNTKDLLFIFLLCNCLYYSFSLDHSFTVVNFPQKGEEKIKYIHNKIKNTINGQL